MKKKTRAAKQQTTRRAVTEWGKIGFSEILQNLEGHLPQGLRFKADAFGILGALPVENWKNLALKKGKTLRSDIERLSRDVSSQTGDIIETLKSNVNQVVDRVQHSPVLEQAFDKVSDAKNQVLTRLNIPSQSEIDRLSRKVTALEKRLGSLARHGRRPRA